MFRSATKLVALAAGLTVSGQAFAQASDTASGDASISLIDPISVTAGDDLLFGRVVKGDTGTNTVTINETTGVRGAIGGGGNAALAGGTVGRATFDVTGEPNTGFSIAFGPSTGTISLTDSGTGSISATLALSGTSGTTNGSGNASFGVGGTLTIDNTDSNDQAGTYNGTFDVTVTYN